MSVLVALACHERARDSVFYEHLLRIRFAEDIEIKQARDPTLARSRNVLCEYALEKGHSHIFFIDDDHAFAPSVLTKLMGHDLDIVSATYIMRHWPFHAVLFSHENDAGSLFPLALQDGMQGLVRIAGCGAGALLIKCSALLRMERPWFKIGDPIVDLANEDFNFCKNATRSGIEMWADLDCIFGHPPAAMIWPWRNEQGQWSTCMTSGAEKLYFPPALGLLAMQKARQDAEAHKDDRIISLS